jgi:hypothetical protein
MVANAAIGDEQYARYIASMELKSEKSPLNFVVWNGCKKPVTWELQTAVKDPLSGSNALKVCCSDNAADKNGDEWHATGYWDLKDTYSNWTGAQFLEFWIKNDTGLNFAIQIQLTEFDKNNAPAGEPWRTKVKTEVYYEENGDFVKRTSDVSAAETYNEYAKSSEGAIAIPKGFTGRIRVAINSNNFYRATWFAAMPGDGSNNTIDKNKFAQLSFSYDPRIVESNATWYLDSIKVVAPNESLYKSVAYSKLDCNNETNETSSTPTSGKVSDTTTTTKSIVGTTTSKQDTSTTAGSGQHSSITDSSFQTESSTGITSAVSTEETGNSSGQQTAGSSEEGLSTGTIVAIVIAVIVLLAGGGGIAFVIIKGKKQEN